MPEAGASASADYNFQINLRGIIELLSGHIYSSPQVFLRELLQNAVDALRARSYLEPGRDGRIGVEVLGQGSKRTLIVEDDGIGLTESEVHQFLATIGQSSKRDDLWDQPVDFIGRFGIGLLSCFVVSDEIVVVTRSAREPHSRGVEWRGRADGTYSVKPLTSEVGIGTKTYLTCKPGFEDYFEPEKILELAQRYGGLLPYPIEMTSGGRPVRINADGAPWRQSHRTRDDRDAALAAYGKKTFGIEFIDAIPLRSEAGDIDGVAFVLPFSPNLAARQSHRVYLKNMLLSESAEKILPDWAFFVKCVVNVNALKPTASRESFQEDEALEQARQALGDCLRDHLVKLANRDPERIQRIIALHYLSIKGLAVDDDDFYRLFIRWLPFETSLGRMTLDECLKISPTLRYTPSLDEFRQIASVAAAQSICVINGAYTYDRDLIEKFPIVFEDERIERIDPAGIAQNFDDLDLDEQDAAFEFLREADRCLRSFRCIAEIKKFLPAELPALYSIDSETEFQREVEQTKERSSSLWSSVLEGIAPQFQGSGMAQLCFNRNNPLIRKLIGVKDRGALRKILPLLYVQALLMGHRPLRGKELETLNQGLIDLIEWGLDARSAPDSGSEPGPGPAPGRERNEGS